MKRHVKSWLQAGMLAAALVCFLAPRAAAQNDGTLHGTILDVTGKPWVDLGIQIVSDMGQKSDTKTDKDGNFAFHNLRSGLYQVFIQLPAPNQPYQVQAKVQGNDAPPINLNFKDIVSKQGAQYQEQIKKQEEQKQKFQGMKQHFDAGVALLTQVGQAKADLAKTPADQRDAAKAKVKELSDQAVTEFETSQKSAPENDPNLHLIYARLGDSYDAAGRADDAIAAYKKAIELKPVPGYYNNLGGIEGRAGKIEDATAAYQKSAELDPPNAAQAWRNFGITMYNANRLGDAVDPLQKSVALDPKNAQAWYLLGASLVTKMTSKKVGDKEVFEFAPGTIEAYQKAIDLDPNGTWGQQAKAGLEQLQAIAPGIDIKINNKKKKT